MKNIKRIGILALICILLFSIMTVGVCAAAQPNDPQTDTSVTDTPLYQIEGEDMGLPERIEYAIQGTVTGLVMVFAVLALLAIVISLSKVILYDMPRKAKERAASKAKAKAKAKAEAEKEEEIMAQAAHAPVVPVPQTDDGELIAVITAAVAAAIESGDYGSEFASGFRVVSFNRVNKGTWNKR